MRLCTIWRWSLLRRSHGCGRAAKRRSHPYPHGNYLVGTLLKASAASAASAIVYAPALVRAQVKEIVIGGPAGAAKSFNANVFPIVGKGGIKIVYEGTRSLVNLEKMQKNKDKPKCRSS